MKVSKNNKKISVNQPKVIITPKNVYQNSISQGRTLNNDIGLSVNDIDTSGNTQAQPLDSFDPSPLKPINLNLKRSRHNQPDTQYKTIGTDLSSQFDERGILSPTNVQLNAQVFSQPKLKAPAMGVVVASGSISFRQMQKIQQSQNFMMGRRRKKDLTTTNCLSADFGIISEDEVVPQPQLCKNFSAVSSSNNLNGPPDSRLISFISSNNTLKMKKAVECKFDKPKPLTEKQMKIREYRRNKILNQDDDPFGIKDDESPKVITPTTKQSTTRVKTLKPQKQDTIIDYPRHIQVSSESQDLQQVRTKLRQQQFFHHKFDPEMQNYSNRHIYSGVYSPNVKMNPFDEKKISAKEFIRNECPRNMTMEPNLIVIDSEPKGAKKMEKTQKSSFSVQQLQMFKRIRNYPQQILKQFAHKNTSANLAPGELEEVPLRITNEGQMAIKGLIEKKREEVYAKVKANFLSQRRQIEDQLDQGFQCVYNEAPKSNGEVYKKALKMVYETEKLHEMQSSGQPVKINFFESRSSSKGERTLKEAEDMEPIEIYLKNLGKSHGSNNRITNTSPHLTEMRSPKSKYNSDLNQVIGFKLAKQRVVNKPKTADKSCRHRIKPEIVRQDDLKIDYKQLSAKKSPTNAERIASSNFIKSVQNANELFVTLQNQIQTNYKQKEQKNIELKKTIHHQLKVRKLRQSLKQDGQEGMLDSVDFHDNFCKLSQKQMDLVQTQTINIEEIESNINSIFDKVMRTKRYTTIQKDDDDTCHKKKFNQKKKKKKQKEDQEQEELKITQEEERVESQSPKSSVKSLSSRIKRQKTQSPPQRSPQPMIDYSSSKPDVERKVAQFIQKLAKSIYQNNQDVSDLNRVLRQCFSENEFIKENTIQEMDEQTAAIYDYNNCYIDAVNRLQENLQTNDVRNTDPDQLNVKQIMEDQILSDKENYENFIKPNQDKKGDNIKQHAKMKSIMGIRNTKIWKPSDNAKFIDNLIQQTEKLIQKIHLQECDVKKKEWKISQKKIKKEQKNAYLRIEEEQPQPAEHEQTLAAPVKQAKLEKKATMRSSK